MNSYRFDKYYFKVNPPKTPWKRFLFWLAPVQVSMDFGYSRCDSPNLVFFKLVQGQIYILETLRTSQS